MTDPSVHHTSFADLVHGFGVPGNRDGPAASPVAAARRLLAALREA
jgi:hypothetical protein